IMPFDGGSCIISWTSIHNEYPMFRRIMTSCFPVAIAAILGAVARSADQPLEWKAGRAAAVITPTVPMLMAGYAARKEPSEGTEQDLFAKALAIEDAGGKRLVFITLDLIGVSAALRSSVTQQ